MRKRMVRFAFSSLAGEEKGLFNADRSMNDSQWGAYERLSNLLKSPCLDFTREYAFWFKRGAVCRHKELIRLLLDTVDVDRKYLCIRRQWIPDDVVYQDKDQVATLVN